MNKNWNQVIPLILAIFVVILINHPATGLKCYECSTSWSDDCRMSPPPSKYLKICPVPLCSKFYAEENGIIRVERYCGGTDFTNGCREASFPDRLPGARYFPAVTCRCGDQDGCNKGFTTVSIGVFLTFAVSVLPMILV